MGGDMPDNSPFVERLLTANEVLAANQNSYDARQLFRKNGHVVWTSKIPDSKNVYLAFFNLNEKTESISVELNDLGIKSSVNVRDLWEEQDLGKFKKRFDAEVNSHGAAIFKLSVN